MTSFYDTTIGQQIEFQRVLASAGFTDGDIARIIKDTSLASKMYEAVRLDEPATVTSWCVTPECQLERARTLWPDAFLPEPPAHFVPCTKTEVLLLHVPDTFDNLWDKVVAPNGYTKFRWGAVKSDNKHLRLAPNKHAYTEPVWLGFDPEHGRGKHPDSFWGQPNLAASEVLSALIQFPDWPLVWFNGASAPDLAGYQLKYGTDWSHAPYVYRRDDDRQLGLCTERADRAFDLYAAPVVREC